MKNFLIAALIIGLAVSLYFNFANRTAKPNENVRSFEIGKDSMRISLRIPAADLISLKDTLSRPSFVALQHQVNTNGDTTTAIPENGARNFVAGEVNEIICADLQDCSTLSLKKGGIQTPPNIIKDKFVRVSVIFELLRFTLLQKKNVKEIISNK